MLKLFESIWVVRVAVNGWIEGDRVNDNDGIKVIKKKSKLILGWLFECDSINGWMINWLISCNWLISNEKSYRRSFYEKGVDKGWQCDVVRNKCTANGKRDTSAY